jgi:Predicted transcriptional regulator
MLYLNLKRIFTAAGVRQPRKFLAQMGYKDTTIHRIMFQTARIVRLHELERMCLKFGCTPNDLLEWVPSAADAERDIPLQQLRMKDELFIDDMVMKLSYDEQLELKEIIKERFGKKEEKSQLQNHGL